MSADLPYLVPATRRRRVCAGLVNAFSVGAIAGLASVFDTGSAVVLRNHVGTQLGVVALLVALWCVYILKKKSLGALFCMLEVRSLDGSVPRAFQLVSRSLLIMFTVMLVYVPTAIIPDFLLVSWVVVLVLSLMGLAVFSLVFIFSGFSVLDALSDTKVFQIKLPEHAMPKVLGVKIM